MKLLDVFKLWEHGRGEFFQSFNTFNTNLGRGLVNHLLKGEFGENIE